MAATAPETGNLEDTVIFEHLMRPGPAVDDIPSGQREQIAAALLPVPTHLHALLPLLTDTHNHMAGFGPAQRQTFNEELSRIKAGQGDLGAREYCVVTVEPRDWSTCSSAAWSRLGKEDQVHVRPLFGIHPQCVAGIDIDASLWQRRLREHLDTCPWSFVGEIGLDRNKWHKPSFDDGRQTSVFQHHMTIAAELRRPVSVHCVKADGAMVQVLQNLAKGEARTVAADGGGGGSGSTDSAQEPLPQIPPAVCMHSFSGSLDSARMIIRALESKEANRGKKRKDRPCRVYFSFNAWTNLFKADIGKLVRGLVDDGGECRLLLESDWNSENFNFPGASWSDVDKILLWGVSKLAEILDWEPKRVAELLRDNTGIFLASITGD